MNLFQLSIKNIKTNYKNYNVYFISILINIIIFNVYSTIATTSKLKDLLGEQNMGVAKILFNLSSCVVVLFSIIFIWNSTNFFIKKRKREIGIYALLGVKNKQIAKMMAFETAIMGLAAMVIGVMASAILSQIFVRILMYFVDVNVSIGFVFSSKALVNTLIVFGILFLFISRRAYKLVYKFKLIDLFNGEKQKEKKSKFGATKGFLSIVLLIFGYLCGSFKINLQAATPFAALICVIFGTYLFYDSFFIFFISIMKKNSKSYYKGERMVVLSNIMYRMRSNAKALTVVTILNTSIIVALSVCLGITSMFNKTLNQYHFSYSFFTNNELDKKVDDIVNKYPGNKTLQDLALKAIKIDDSQIIFSNKKVNNTGTANNKEKNYYYIIKKSEYNDVVKKLNLKNIVDLKNPNDIVVLNNGKALEDKNGIAFFKNENSPKVTAEVALDKAKQTFNVVKYEEELMNTGILYGGVIVNDELFDKFKTIGEEVKARGIKVSDDKHSKNLTNELEEDFKEGKNKISSFYPDYSQGKGIEGTLKFIAFFTSLIFVISSLSVIYFKLIMEADEEVKRYSIMRKIGLSLNKVKKCVSKQTLTLFSVPLLLGVVHSIAALSILISQIIEVVLIVVLAFILIYGAFCSMTSRSYFKYLRERV